MRVYGGCCPTQLSSCSFVSVQRKESEWSCLPLTAATTAGHGVIWCKLCYTSFSLKSKPVLVMSAFLVIWWRYWPSWWWRNSWSALPRTGLWNPPFQFPESKFVFQKGAALLVNFTSHGSYHSVENQIRVGNSVIVQVMTKVSEVAGQPEGQFHAHKRNEGWKMMNTVLAPFVKHKNNFWLSQELKSLLLASTQSLCRSTQWQCGHDSFYSLISPLSSREHLNWFLWWDSYLSS